MKQSSSAKYQHIRASLEAAIRNGEFVAGEQLPTEQALADRYGVSYLTARRAVCELVEADLLERRARKGTFVRLHNAQPMTTTLSLVTSSYDHAVMREFINRGVRLAEQHNWQANVIRLYAGQQDAAVRAVRNGDLALVLLDEISPHSALAHAMRAAKGRAICLGSATIEAGVPCILNEPEEVFRTAVNYLVGKGHRHIVSVTQCADVAWVEIQKEAWQKAAPAFMSPAEVEKNQLLVHTPHFECPTHDTYDVICEFLARDDQTTTAFIGFGDEITQGILAAIRDSGRTVPEDISVVNMMDSPSMCFSHPPVTSIDMNFERQFEIAFELLEASRSGAIATPKNHFVLPRIIERSSVVALEASATKTRHAKTPELTASLI